MDFGLGILGHHGAASDVAFAERHGFITAGFVDSPLLAADPFVGLGLAATATTSIRLGTFLAVPGNRSPATTASAIATINRLAPGRAFLGIGTGYTSRNVLGLRAVPVAEFERFARECGELLRDRFGHTERDGVRFDYRFAHEPDRYVATTPRVPIYLAGDGPKALDAVGKYGDGWVSTMQFADMMRNVDEVFSASRRTVDHAATAAGRDGAEYRILSTAVGLISVGESPVSERLLALVGPMAMLPFHSYATNPAIADFLPPVIQSRLGVYEREVLARLPGSADERHQWAHRGHLSFLLPGEDKVLTEEILRMTTLTGTVDEVELVLVALEAAGLSNLTTWIPPHLLRDTVVDLERQLISRFRRDGDESLRAKPRPSHTEGES
jgi:5,10-methylenetetrahydromethanopterin reductase